MRFRLEQGFHTAESSFHQALRFKFGEVTVRSLQQPEKPVFSFFVDANRDVLHLQLRTAIPVDFVVGLEGDGEHKALKDHKRLRIRNADHALVVLCDGMEPGEGLELRNPASATAFDLQVHLLREVPKVEKLDETLGGIEDPSSHAIRVSCLLDTLTHSTALADSQRRDARSRV